jgi:hypothetical protein
LNSPSSIVASCLTCTQFGEGTAAQAAAGKKGGERAKELGAGIVSGAADELCHCFLPRLPFYIDVPAALIVVH